MQLFFEIKIPVNAVFTRKLAEQVMGIEEILDLKSLVKYGGLSVRFQFVPLPYHFVDYKSLLVSA